MCPERAANRLRNPAITVNTQHFQAGDMVLIANRHNRLTNKSPHARVLQAVAASDGDTRSTAIEATA